MSKSWQYNPSSRYIGQAAMWVILGATIALAAVVDLHRRGALAVTLDKPQSHKGVTAALPKGWEVTRGRDVDWSEVFEAKESDEDEESSQRVITITRELLSSHDSPMEYLQHELSISQRRKTSQEASKLGGFPAVMISYTGSIPALQFGIPMGSVPTKNVAICAVPASGRPILIHLSGVGRDADAQDVDLVRD